MRSHLRHRGSIPKINIGFDAREADRFLLLFVICIVVAGIILFGWPARSAEQEGWKQAGRADDIIIKLSRGKGTAYMQLDLGDYYFLAIPAGAKLRPGAMLRLCPKKGPTWKSCIIHREQPKKGYTILFPPGHWTEESIKEAKPCPPHKQQQDLKTVCIEYK